MFPILLSSKAVEPFEPPAEGKLFTWGDATTYGMTGHGDTTDRSSPTVVGAQTDWVALNQALNQTIAVKSTGKLYTWGRNFLGALGDGTTTDRSSPVQVGALTTWKKWISCGGHTMKAVKTDGKLWTWGYGGQGQNGRGNTLSFSSPVQIGTDANWASTIGSQGVTQGGIRGGLLFTWGLGTAGALGGGVVSPNSSSPTQIGSQTDWKQGTAGMNHMCVIKTTGKLYCWGRNDVNCLGDGTSTNTSSPNQIGALTDWNYIVAGAYSNLALKTDGTLWAWGWSSGGNLGDGTTVQRNSPVLVGAAIGNWLGIAKGRQHTFAVKDNGALYAWGNNGDGELGLGNTTSYSAPQQVGAVLTWKPMGALDAYATGTRGNGKFSGEILGP